MNDLEDLLPAALHRAAGNAPHRPDLALVARRGLRRRRLRRAGTAVGALAAASVVVGAAVAVVTRDDGLLMAGAGAAATGACRSTVSRDPLPEWARASADAASERWRGSGQPAGTRPPHVLSAEGDFMAILPPGRTLHAPSRDAMADMIQFVARRTPDGPAKLVVRRDGTGQAVAAIADDYDLNDVTTKAPIGMDEPGCYRFVFTWDGLTRSIDLQWQAGPDWSSAKLPPAIQDAVTRHTKDHRPPPGGGLGSVYQWVRSTRGTVTRTLGPDADPIAARPSASTGTTPAPDPDQAVYVVQVTYGENDQADIRGLRVVVAVDDDGTPSDVVGRSDTPWTDLSRLGTPHVQDLVTDRDSDSAVG
jgi:hypothetical protein